VQAAELSAASEPVQAQDPDDAAAVRKLGRPAAPAALSGSCACAIWAGRQRRRRCQVPAPAHLTRTLSRTYWALALDLPQCLQVQVKLCRRTTPTTPLQQCMRSCVRATSGKLLLAT